MNKESTGISSFDRAPTKESHGKMQLISVTFLNPEYFLDEFVDEVGMGNFFDQSNCFFLILILEFCTNIL